LTHQLENLPILYFYRSLANQCNYYNIKQSHFYHVEHYFIFFGSYVEHYFNFNISVILMAIEQKSVIIDLYTPARILHILDHQQNQTHYTGHWRVNKMGTSTTIIKTVDKTIKLKI
jgi:hypothetical protein